MHKIIDHALQRIIRPEKLPNAIVVDGIEFRINQKKVKHIRFRIDRQSGKVAMTVPKYVDMDIIQSAINEKLKWVKKHCEIIAQQPAAPEYIYTSGEFHPLFGVRHELEVIEKDARPSVEPGEQLVLRMYVTPGLPIEKRAALLENWYRQQIKHKVEVLINKWQKIIGVSVNKFGIRKMKTRWGSCNIHAARIWINLELVKRPVEHLEYVVVHEMVHLLERLHNARFKSYMDKFIPQWRSYEAALNSAPV